MFFKILTQEPKIVLGNFEIIMLLHKQFLTHCALLNHFDNEASLSITFALALHGCDGIVKNASIGHPPAHHITCSKDL